MLIRSAARRPDGDLYREVADSEAAQWSLDQHLLASVVDRLTALTYVTTLAHTDPKKRDRVPRPQFIDRPGAPAASAPAPGGFRFGGRYGSRELQQIQ